MKIGFIGLGDIGEPIASHLSKEPFELTVWNRTAAKANEFARNHKARVAATPADAVRDAAVVITCLPSSAEVEAVLHGENGILEAMRKGSVLIDCTSGDPRRFCAFFRNSRDANNSARDENQMIRHNNRPNRLSNLR